MPTAVGMGKRPRRNSVESYLLTGFSLPQLEERNVQEITSFFQGVKASTRDGPLIQTGHRPRPRFLNFSVFSIGESHEARPQESRSGGERCRHGRRFSGRRRGRGGGWGGIYVVCAPA